MPPRGQNTKGQTTFTYEKISNCMLDPILYVIGVFELLTGLRYALG